MRKPKNQKYREDRPTLNKPRGAKQESGRIAVREAGLA